MKYAALNVHTQYSILKSTISVADVATKAKKLGIKSVGIADAGAMYGAVDFYKSCKANKIHPVIGLEIRLAPTSRKEKKKIHGKKPGYPIALYAINEEGYRNLCALSSIGFTEGFYYTPRIDKVVLREHSAGLICLSGPQEGPVAQAILEENGDEEVEWFQKVFGDRFYLQIERLAMEKPEFKESWLQGAYEKFIEDETKINDALVKTGIPLVATNTCYYLEQNDWLAQEVLMNVGTGETIEMIERDALGNPKGKSPNPKRSVLYSREHYLRSPQEMQKRFKDLPEALENTQKIAEQCQFEFDFKTKHYPVYVPPELEGQEYTNDERDKSAKQYLKDLCYQGITTRYTEDRLAKVKEKYPDQDPLQVVKDRLKYELDLVTRMGMCDYLLIVYDFISWAKRQGIPVGPGRGSGAGSIILYLIEITDIEPLRFSLFFERFINPERISYPDIDVDICMERRDEVIEYTLKKYGKKNVAQIITFGTMKAKMAIRDVGRVLNVPLPKVNDIVKLVPDDLGMTLEKALEIDPELKRLSQEDDEAKKIIEFARKLEGSIRNSGIHAAGLIISGDELTNHIPVCTSKESSILATQYAMKPVEAVGMLKIDFLGLKTLTSIQKTVKAVGSSQGKVVDWVNLPLNDQKTFDLLNEGKTSGVFQLESGGMQDLIRQLHIDKFEEIIAVGALYRPGPMEMIPSFINRKHGREKIEFEHSHLEGILSETYGIMVYQEQVLQIASKLALYSLGEGDVLRKAMGKKEHAEMRKQKEKFKKGAADNGISEEIAMEIFDKIEKFASYGFNKAHATAYGYLSYVTAYLKANYQKEWMASLMTCDMDNIEKVAKHTAEAEALGIEILPPDINESGAEFVATPSGIRFALSAIKGVGKGASIIIEKERGKNGPFKSLYDLCCRVDIKKLGKKNIEILIQVGCFDGSGWTRAQMLETVDAMIEASARQQKEKALGIMDLFANDVTNASEQFQTPPDVTPISKMQRLAWEKELLGLYLSGHPMEEYQDIIEKHGCITFEKLREIDDLAAPIACVIDTVKIKVSKAGRKFAVITVQDGTNQEELALFADLFENNLDKLQEGKLIVLIITKDGEQLRVRYLGELETMDEEAVEQMQTALKMAKKKPRKRAEVQKTEGEKKSEVEKTLKLLMKIDADAATLSHILQVKKLFTKHCGHIAVDIQFESGSGKEHHLAIGSEWGVRFDHNLEMELKKLRFIRSVQLVSL